MENRKNESAIAERKQRNVAIFRQTIDCISRGEYTTPSGRTVQLDFTDMLKGSKCYQQEIPAISAPNIVGETKVLVESNDCLVIAGRLVSEDYNPLLLNFACAENPGGGVEIGARAQEATICRRSTLTRSIYAFHKDSATKYEYNLIPGNNYPITSSYSAIYSPCVTVFREGVDCTMMENPYNVAVVSCAALNLYGNYPIKLTEEGHMPQVAIDITRCKIRTIFRIGLLHGHDALILGAFGCGVFHNPPAEVARLFHEVMEEEEFKNKFKLITFAIIEDHNSNNDNFRQFQTEFGYEEQ